MSIFGAKVDVENFRPKSLNNGDAHQ